jgi:MraZ protein
MPFLGNIDAKIDMKGRAFLPAAFRKILQANGEDSLVLCPDIYQPCLALYPEAVWETQLTSFKSKLNRWNAQHQLMLRKFLEDVQTVNLDANGRFLIPKKMIDKFGIDTDIRFLGMNDYIEIWKNDRETFMDEETFRKNIAELMNDTAEPTP